MWSNTRVLYNLKCTLYPLSCILTFMESNRTIVLMDFHCSGTSGALLRKCQISAKYACKPKGSFLVCLVEFGNSVRSRYVCSQSPMPLENIQANELRKVLDIIGWKSGLRCSICQWTKHGGVLSRYGCILKCPEWCILERMSLYSVVQENPRLPEKFP